MSKIQHRTFSGDIQVRMDGDGKPPTITGHAAVFHEEGNARTEFQLLDTLVERIKPGAFTRALSDQDDTRALFNHDPNQILGRTPNTLRMRADSRGLAYEVDVADTQAGRDIVTSIKRGDVTGSSFGFTVDDSDFIAQEDGPDVLEIRAVTLYDVSPATYPAYEGTDAAARTVRSLEAMRADHEAGRNVPAWLPAYLDWRDAREKEKREQVEGVRATDAARLRLREIESVHLWPNH
jgi:HK97 family phage prohead protease